MNLQTQPVSPRNRGRIALSPGLGLLVVLVAAVAIGVRSLSAGAPQSNVSAGSSAVPATVADPAAQFFASARWVATTPQGWVLGQADGRTLLLPAKIPGSEARVDWGHVTIATVDETAGMWRFMTGDTASGSFAEAYARNGFRADVQATVGPDGTHLYYAVGTGSGTDGGLYAVDLATKTEQTLVPSGPAPDPSSRIRLEWSPSGRTLASSLCGFETCAIDVVDPSTLAARRLGSTALLTAISDVYALGTIGIHGGWVRIDLATGAEMPLGSGTIADAHEGWALEDGSFVISGWSADRTAYVIAVASVDGSARTVYTQPAADAKLLQRIGSPGRFVLVGPELADLLAKGGGALDVVDLEMGTSQSEAYRVSP